MKDDRAVLYAFKSHNKYNGTLFYCFEYYCKAREINPDVLFYIFNISKEELESVKDVFKNRYQFPIAYLEGIKSLSTIQELHQLNTKSNLILDIHTFDQIYYFLKGDIYCYSNVGHEMKRSEFKKIIYFGHYKYQNFDYNVKLKLNFFIFKKIERSNPDGIFVSSRKDNYKDFKLPKELEHLKPINKDKNSHYQNLFELFDTIYYFHSDLDTNNRLIPEAFFYNKKIYIEFNGNKEDSIYLRYQDILSNGLKPYTLEQDDLMLSMFLGATK